MSFDHLKKDFASFSHFSHSQLILCEFTSYTGLTSKIEDPVLLLVGLI